MRLRNQQGFTLIELVVVIVILGILAATAAPKFIDLSHDAKIAGLKGVAGALHSAASMTYASAVMNGVHNQNKNSSAVMVDGVEVELKWGYPEAYAEEGSDDKYGIEELLELSDEWFSCTIDDPNADNSDGECGTRDGDAIRFAYSAAELGTNNGCYVQYTEANSDISEANKYQVSIVDNGC